MERQGRRLVWEAKRTNEGFPPALMLFCERVSVLSLLWSRNGMVLSGWVFVLECFTACEERDAGRQTGRGRDLPNIVITHSPLTPSRPFPHSPSTLLKPRRRK